MGPYNAPSTTPPQTIKVGSIFRIVFYSVPPQKKMYLILL